MNPRFNEKIQRKDNYCYNIDMAQLLTTSTYTFELFKEYGYMYVDKTHLLYKLITTNRFVFLSRPRRFGKSLVLTTLKSIFEGRRDLFENLHISKTNYDWKKYPVIHISLGSCSASTREGLNKYLNSVLEYNSERLDTTISKEDDATTNFGKLITNLAKKDKVVILIDEYEKAITDNIYNPNIEELRDALSDFYQVLKDQDSNIHFTFITGVTKYTKLSIFSKLNNLRDISMTKEYATLLGFTQEELDYYFRDHIEEAIKENGFNEDIYRKRIKDMYDGYRFYPGAECVYNPVSIGTFFLDGGDWFRNYWMDTGGNTLVYDISKKVDFNMVSDLSEPLAETALSIFDLGKIANNTIDKDFLKSLLYQTGYLSIVRRNEDGSGLYLEFPNGEVRSTFNLCYLAYYTEKDEIYFQGTTSIRNAIFTGNTDKLIKSMKSMFAGIPSLVSSKAKYSNEYYYESLIYMILNASGIKITIEEMTNRGRIDAVAESNAHIYIMEFKKDKTAKEAIRQIKENNYAERYLASGKKIHLLGINFSTKQRNIDDVIVEDL